MATLQKTKIDKDSGVKYRVMHHIGGFQPTETEPMHDHIPGGIEHLNIITLDTLPPEINLDRLVTLGAIRPATEAEIAEFDKGNHGVQDTIREDEPNPEQFATNPTGKGDDTGKINIEKMSKAELSNFTKADLVIEAQARQIPGYTIMNKEELLDALVASKKA
jgi:hypothetical protein